MKQLRHLIAAALTMIMALAIATPALAGTIKITRDGSYDPGDGSVNRTYTAYKVFDADTSLSGDDKGTNTQADPKTITYGSDGPIAYTMATDSPWKTAMLDSAQTWFDVELAADQSKYVVTLKDTVADTAETAQAIAAYLKANLPTSGVTTYQINPGTEVTVADGYYLILASDGATNLTLVTDDVVIIEKNEYIGTTKTTAETSYNIGDTVTYTATVYIPTSTSLTDPVILHDEMDDVLAFNEDVTATIDGAAFTGFTTSYDDGAAAITDNCTFELYIPVNSSVLGKTITFTYTAEVTAAAATDTGLVNTLWGEKNGYTTKPNSPKVYTFDFDIDKQFMAPTLQDDVNLTATFNLYTADEYAKLTDDDASTTAAPINFTNASDSHKYIVAKTGGSPTITVNGAQGVTENILGLKAGTYYLVEKTTSTGYNLLDDAVMVTITDLTDTTQANWQPRHKVTYKLSKDTGAAAEGTVTIQNQAGTVLPSTGGIGTTIFYVIGGAMVITAGVLLVTKRRMSKIED